jgi:Bacterial PH domain/zinc-ribbon domain
MMFCHKCGSSLPNESLFCARCGARVPTGGAPAVAPPAQAPHAAVAPPAPVAPPAYEPPPVAAPVVPRDAPSGQSAGIAREAQVATRAGAVAADPRLERDVWTGRYSSKAMATSFIALGAWVILMIVIAASLAKGPWWLWLALIVGPAGYVFGRLLYLKWTIKYRLTTQRFFHTYGFTVQRTDETELIRMDDVTLEQTLIERMFDVGTLIIESTDKSEPKKMIRGISRPLEVKEFVRSYALQLRQGQGVMRVHTM